MSDEPVLSVKDRLKAFEQQQQQNNGVIASKGLKANSLPTRNGTSSAPAHNAQEAALTSQAAAAKAASDVKNGYGSRTDVKSVIGLFDQPTRQRAVSANSKSSQDLIDSINPSLEARLNKFQSLSPSPGNSRAASPTFASQSTATSPPAQSLSESFALIDKLDSGRPRSASATTSSSHSPSLSTPILVSPQNSGSISSETSSAFRRPKANDLTKNMSSSGVSDSTILVSVLPPSPDAVVKTGGSGPPTLPQRRQSSNSLKSMSINDVPKKLDTKPSQSSLGKENKTLGPTLPPRKAMSLQSSPVASPVAVQQPASATTGKSPPLLPPRPPNTQLSAPSLSSGAINGTRSVSMPPTSSGPASIAQVHSPKSLPLRQPAETSVRPSKARPIDPRARRRFVTVWDKQIALMRLRQDQSAKMPGLVVAEIWQRSGLPAATLRQIWISCDVDKTGALDQQAFCEGMWQIDECLRVNQRI